MNEKMNKTYIPTLIILVLLFVLHYCGNNFFLYVRYPGYDVLMHVLGGVALALAFYWFEVTFLKNTFFGKNPWTIIFLTLIAGFAWEWFEAYYQISGGIPGTEAYSVDTGKDLINDTFGALIAYLAILRIKK